MFAAAVGGAGALRAQGAPPGADSVARRAARDSLAARATADSLAARLERAESAIELLRQQLAVEASSAVHTRSRLQVEFSARILMNTFSSSGPVNTVDVPAYVVSEAAPRPANARDAQAFGISLRQSRAGFALSVDSVLGGKFGAEVELDFFGGRSAGAGDAYLLPQPRLRSAALAIHWSRTELMVGSEAPLIAELNPVTLASVGQPGFSGAGNLWSWLPQLRLTQEIGSRTFGATRVHWAVQGAVLHPASPLQSATEEYGVTVAARSGRPYVQGRLRLGWEDASTSGSGDVRADRGGEIGVGVHRGWLALAGDTLSTSSGVSVSARVGLRHGVELRGEAYQGRGLSGLGGGAIEQTLGLPAPGAAQGVLLRDAGGWAQLNWQATTTFMTGAGCGVDRVEPADRPERRRNEVCAVHAMWRPAQPLVVGIEFRGLRTQYSDRSVSGRHINLSIGFEI